MRQDMTDMDRFHIECMDKLDDFTVIDMTGAWPDYRTLLEDLYGEDINQ